MCFLLGVLCVPCLFITIHNNVTTICYLLTVPVSDPVLVIMRITVPALSDTVAVPLIKSIAAVLE